ncbi:hypothetical protein CQW23_35154 [Capsicum baccatum]|uniref:Uncharacterized protein n=1 Tax=Capsicum baccatum TaxID=33114 RepID=A0A2G2UWU0_CAPBA|nr:hypothetical protein CQW23_35154 [Capsicum baccatum]
MVSDDSYGTLHLFAIEVRLEVIGKKAKNATFISGTEDTKISKEIQKVEKRRIVKSTLCNEQSSRSHCMVSPSRSFKECSSMVIQLSEEKAQAEEEIEMLKKIMSVRSAEVANKQHLEGVKKITKLVAERRRLSGLMWKKLLGPTALAQMKLDLTTQAYDDLEKVKKIAKLDAERQRLRGLEHLLFFFTD